MTDITEIIANQPVVIDNGTGAIKAGFAGGEQPKIYFPNYVGRPKHKKCMAGAIEGDFFIGSKAHELRGLLQVDYPMRHGVVQDWEEMERVWRSIYTDLKINAHEHPVLLTECPYNPTKSREKAAEIFFETFNCPAFFVSMQAVLSLYASGETTGLVLDSGEGVSYSVPVVDGFAVTNSIMRSDLAGRDVTERMKMLLRKGGHNFDTSAEFEVVKTIKEKCCYVAYDPAKEEEKLSQTTGADIEESMSLKYALPDGNIIEVMGERFRAPEILFDPLLIGSEAMPVQQCLLNSIRRSDLDLRKRLFSAIHLSGGSTKFKGFGARLLKEVKALAPRDVKIKIFATPDRHLSTWIGGSILASLPTFKNMWISAEQFEEQGMSIVHKKTF